MERIEPVDVVTDIPEDFDITRLRCLDGGWSIAMQVEDWIYISLLCDRSDIFQGNEYPDIVEEFKEKVREVTVKAFNIYANKNNYAKEMVEKGLWPDHSKKDSQTR